MGEYSYASGLDNATALLESGVDSLFCSNDFLAFGALDAAARLGRRLPDDVWIVGYDDVPMAAWGRTGLTTVRQVALLLAAGAVELLMARIQGPQMPARSSVLEPKLIRRGSTRAGVAR